MNTHHKPDEWGNKVKFVVCSNWPIFLPSRQIAQLEPLDFLEEEIVENFMSDTK
jgi:hypothetical protein